MNFQFNEDHSLVPHGNLPKSLPSPVASESLLPTPELPAFSAFMDSPLFLRQSFDCNSLRIHQPQKELEQQAQRQLLQNQQSNMEPPRRDHSWLPQHELGFVVPQLKQTTMGPPASNNFKLEQQHLRFMEHQSSQKQLRSIEPPVSNHYQVQQQHIRFMEPQLQTSLDPCVGNHRQSQHQLRFVDRQLQQHSSIQPPVSNHIKLQQQQLKFLEAGLQSMQKRQTETHPLLSKNYEHMRCLEKPLKIGGGQPPRQSVATQLQSPNVANRLSHRASLKGKEKVTSFPPLPQSSPSAPNQSVVLGLAANVGGQGTLHSSIRSRDDLKHHPPIPRRRDITLDSRNQTVGSSALLEVLSALKECSPPGSQIDDPYKEFNGPLFDIPLSSGGSASSGISRDVGYLNNFPSMSNKKNLFPSRQGRGVTKRRKK